jgi:hypothetical protein
LLCYLIWDSIKLELKETGFGVWTAFIWLRGFYEQSPSFRMAFIRAKKIFFSVSLSLCSEERIHTADV